MRASGSIELESQSNRIPAAYVCVYRHFQPSPKAIRDTLTIAVTAPDPLLSGFVHAYTEGTSYFDWGDDPSFFSAQHFHGSSAYAAWGVCRPNVRSKLKQGDVVIFFCARRRPQVKPTTDYFYIGVGTVGEVIPNRKEIWSKSKYKLYRSHYNVLAKYSRHGLEQHEVFHPTHENWMHRLASPYIVFSPTESRFNLRNPLHVGTSLQGKREIWHSRSDRRVARLEEILFKSLGIKRRLRTSPTGSAHPHINLTRKLLEHSSSPAKLRESLWTLVLV